MDRQDVPERFEGLDGDEMMALVATEMLDMANRQTFKDSMEEGIVLTDQELGFVKAGQIMGVGAAMEWLADNYWLCSWLRG